jgi:pimeloyl-ACP methyl ester carboxylesterase
VRAPGSSPLAYPTDLLRPGRTWSALRDQLGSLRTVYLAGDRVQRRDDAGEHPETVLLLHGFFQTRNIWEVMEDRLRHDGYGVLSFQLGGLLWRFNTHPIDTSARLVADKLASLRTRHGLGKVHIIGHSKGGLIARRYVQAYGGDEWVKSIVTLGTPHHGTPTAAIGVALMGFGALPSSARELLPGSRTVRSLAEDSSKVPLTSIYSREDLVCPYWCSVLRPEQGASPMDNVEVRGVGHSQLVWDTTVYQAVLEALDRASSPA